MIPNPVEIANETYREHGIDITTHGDNAERREVWLVTVDDQGVIVPFNKSLPSTKIVAKPCLIACFPPELGS